MLAFGVSVAVGLAPLLGTVDVPLFKNIIDLFPRYPYDSPNLLIPIASFLMGLVALVFEFASRSHNSRTAIRKWFVISACICIASLMVLFFVYLMVTEHAGERAIPILVGFGQPLCSACQDLGRVACIESITGSLSDISQCFGTLNVKMGFAALALTYFLLMASFGAMVGGLILRETSQQ